MVCFLICFSFLFLYLSAPSMCFLQRRATRRSSRGKGATTTVLSADAPRLLTSDANEATYEVEFSGSEIGIELESDFLSGGQHAIVSGFCIESAASSISRIKTGHYVLAVNGRSLLKMNFQQVLANCN